MTTPPAQSKTARLNLPALIALSCCTLLPTTRATEWVIGGASGTNAFPMGGDEAQGSGLIGNNDTIILYTDVFNGGPQTVARPLVNYQSTSGPTSFSVLSGDGEWYVITNKKSPQYPNPPGTAGDQTRAFTIIAGSTLTLSNISFANNVTANQNGAAIQVTQGAATAGATTLFTGTATFINNRGGTPQTSLTANTMLGGAIHIDYYNFIFSGSFIFKDNAGDRGGALNTGANVINGHFYGDTLFQSNTANTGGAINFQQYQSGTNTFHGNIQFINNTAQIGANTYAVGGGGAIAANVGSNNAASQLWLVFAGTTLFQGNKSMTYGGAIKFGGQGLVIGGNTTFENNTSGTSGGAIFMINSSTTTASPTGNMGNPIAGGVTLTLDATTGDILFRGNIENTGTDFSKTGNHNAISLYSGTYITANSGTTTVTLNTGTGATGNTIYLYDPITITHTAALGNKQNKVNLDILGHGAVLLDTYATYVNGIINTRSGTLKLTNGASLSTTGATTAFTLESPATLSLAGAGNLINAPTINLAPGSTLTLDLLGFSTDSASLLTLNATTLLDTTNWTQYLNLLNLSTLGATEGATYNLITLTGAGATNSLFTRASIRNFLDITGLYDEFNLRVSDDGLNLLLYYGTLDRPENHVLQWTGNSNSSWHADAWTGNWTTSGNPTTFTIGDIVNLAGSPTRTTLDIGATAYTSIAAMYVSGDENYTITGGSIIADPYESGFAGGAATGQLVLGAQARADATAADTAAYTGTLTLANTSNNFLGGILINTGALVGNDKTLGSGTIGINIAAPATLIFDQAADATYTAPITGAGTLIKTNTGALTLAAGNHALTGAATITAGSLLLARSTTLGGTITISTGAAFGGAGVATGPVTVATGGALQVGIGVTGSQTFTLAGNLTLADGAIIDYTSLTNKLQVAGAIAQTGTTTINLNTIQIGAYNLGNLASLYGNTIITIGGNTQHTDARQTATLALDGGNLLLIGSGDISRTLYWTGAAGSATWAYTGANWTDRASINVFGVGDRVTFDDNSTLHHITIVDYGVSVSDMHVNAASDYTFTGGAITVDPASIVPGSTLADATGKLYKAGAGTLTLANDANTFTGGIEIAGGAISFETAAQLGATLSKITFTGADATLITTGPVNFNNNTNANLILVGAADATLALSIIADGPASLFSINNSAGRVDGGALYVNPLSTLTLSGTAADPGGAFIFHANTTTNRGGAIYVGGTATAIIDSATFTNNIANASAGKGGAILVEYSGTLIVRDSTFTNNVSGNGGGNQGNGGAIAGMYGPVIELHNVVFTSNTAYGLGGALFNNTAGAHTLIRSSTFTGNVAIGNSGGAFAAQYGLGPSTFDIYDTLFQSNTTTSQGGAVWIAGNNSGSISNSTFISNTAGTHGGAIALGGINIPLTIENSLFYSNHSGTHGGAIYIGSNNNTLTLTNATFISNRAGGSGGAIYLAGNNTAFTYNVTTGNTSILVNNAARILGDITYAANDYRLNGIYAAGNNMNLTFNIEDGAALHMSDAMRFDIANNQTTNILKTGSGVWYLGGYNYFTPTSDTPENASVIFTIAEGTLHLYRPREATYTIPSLGGYYTSSTYGGHLEAETSTVNVTLTIKDGATLSAGGGNTIFVSRINLEPNAGIRLDLTGAQTADTAGSILSLAGTIFDNGWTQNLGLLNFDELLYQDGDLFNLITLSFGNNFTSAGTFNLIEGLPEGFRLQLSENADILQLYFANILQTNRVLTWNGATTATSDSWRHSNWTAAATGSGTNFHMGDIVNLAGAPASTTLEVNTKSSATLTGMYVSGTTNYTITGSSSIVAATSGVGHLGDTAAATGKLVLGAKASDDAGAIYIIDYSGTLTLANTSNDFQGGIEINTGALVGNSQTLGSGAIGIKNNSHLTFNQTINDTYTAPISGTGLLGKTGAATLTLTAGNSAFTGATEVAAGSLLLAENATLGGSIHTAPTARFGGAGAATGPVSIDTGATLQVGIGDTGGQTLSIGGNLTLADQATLNYTSVANTLRVAGAVNHTGSTTINIDRFLSGTHNLGNLAAIYDHVEIYLGTADGMFQAAHGGNTAGSTDRLQAGFIKNGDDLLVIGIGESHILTWTGTTSNTWSTADANWTERNNTAPVDHFISGDRVIFDDGPDVATHAITNSGTIIRVSDMIVKGDSNYTFSGAGITADTDYVISGTVITNADATAKLLKQGSGTLSFTNAANNFLGGIDLESGAITFTNGNQLNTSTAAAITYTSAATIISRAASAQTIASNITVAAGITGTLDTGLNTTLSGTLASAGGTGTLAKIGTGTLGISGVSIGAAASNLTISINEGFARMIAFGTFAGTLDIAPNTLLFTEGATETGTVLVSGSSTLQYDVGAIRINNLQFANSSTLSILGNGTLLGAITLNGRVTADIQAGATPTITSAITGQGGFLKVGAGELRLSGTAAFGNTGPTQIDQGTLRVTNISGTTNYPNVIQTRTTLEFVDGTLTIPDRVYTIAGVDYVVPGATYTDVPSQSFIIIPSSTFTRIENRVIPECTVTIAGQEVVYPAVTYTVPNSTFVVPEAVITVFGTHAVIPRSVYNPPGNNNAATVAQNVILNGGTLAFRTTTADATTPLTNDATANNWMGIRLIQSDSAATSVVTGNNDIIHVGSGSQVFAIRNGMHVAVNAPGGVTTLNNTTNDFTGLIILNSGTFQINSPTPLGYWGTTNQNKLVLNGGDLLISSNMTTTRAIEMRGDGAIHVEQGVAATWGPVNKTSAYPTAHLTKTGPGTITFTGALQATALTVAEGRYITTSRNHVPNSAGPVTIYLGATFQLNGTATTVSDTIGYIASRQLYILSNNGIITNPFNGEGTLEVTAGRYSFNSPCTDIATILISGASTAISIGSNRPEVDFAPNSTITIDRGSLIFAAVGQNIGDVTLKNDGKLAFLMEGHYVASSTNKVTGVVTPAYYYTYGQGFKHATIKSLTNNDSTAHALWFNTNLEYGRADSITVTGTVTGDYLIGVTDYGAAPKQYYGALELLAVPADSNATFTPLNPIIESGLYKYTVTSTTSEGKVSVILSGSGAMSASASIINSMAAALSLGWFSELESVSLRMGELRMENRDETGGPSTWIRAGAEQFDFNKKVSQMSFDDRRYTIQGGFDYKFPGTRHNYYAGAFIGYGDSRRDYAAAGEGASRSVFGGLYQTLSTPSGLYFDGILKVNGFTNSFTAIAVTGETASAEYTNWAIGASIEAGKYSEDKYGWFFEPQIQAAFTIIAGKDYATDTDFRIEQRPGTTGHARAGFRFGRVFETGNGGRVHAYVKAYAASQWTTNGQLFITTPAGQSQRYVPAIKGNRIEAGAGISWLFTRYSQLYLDYTTTQADYYKKPYGVNLGLRLFW